MSKRYSLSTTVSFRTLLTPMIMLNLLMYNKYRLAHFITPATHPILHPCLLSWPYLLHYLLFQFPLKKKGLHYSLPVLRLWKNYSSPKLIMLPMFSTEYWKSWIIIFFCISSENNSLWSHLLLVLHSPLLKSGKCI